MGQIPYLEAARRHARNLERVAGSGRMEKVLDISRQAKHYAALQIKDSQAAFGVWPEAYHEASRIIERALEIEKDCAKREAAAA